MIPKVAHFIWFGTRPRWVTRNIESFKLHNPTWEVKLHDESTDWLSYMPDDLKQAAVSVKYLCQRADLLSYAIIYKEGGVYIDADVVTLRPFDELRKYEAFTAMQPDERCGKSLIGGVAGSSTYKKILDECRELLKSPIIKRIATGPTLLHRLFVDNQEPGMTILPYHYFYLFGGRAEAHLFYEMDPDIRIRIVEALRRRFSDGVEPFAVHLWGMKGSSLRRTYGHGDALAHRIKKHFGDRDIVGAEIGVLQGRNSEHLLRNCSNVILYMVDRWEPFEPGSRYYRSLSVERSEQDNAKYETYYKRAEKRTRFAAKRRLICKNDSEYAANAFDGDMLHFVFIDADHTYEGCLEDLVAWYPKVVPGGLVSGHDIDNPAGEEGEIKWGVRKAVEEFMQKNCPEAKLELDLGYTWFFVKPKEQRNE